MLAMVFAVVLMTAAPSGLVAAQEGGSSTQPDTEADGATLFESLDGSMVIALGVDELIDPFTSGVSEIELERLEADANRIVGIRMELENLGPTALSSTPSNQIRLLVDGSIVIRPRGIIRDTAARDADPDMQPGAVEPGGTRSGLIFYPVPADAVVDAVIFLPSNDRIVTLVGSVTGGGPSIAATSSAPAATSPPVALPTDASGSDAATPTPADAEGSAATRAPTDSSAQDALPAPVNVDDGTADLDLLEARGTFQGATFGYSAQWEPSQWHVVEVTAEPTLERLVLEGDVFTIEVEGLADPDTVRCLSDRVHADLENAIGFDAVTDMAAPTPDGRVPPDAGIYLLAVDEHNQPERLVRYVECRAAPATDSAVRIVATAPERFWEIDRAVAAEVLDTILPARLDLGAPADGPAGAEDVPDDSAVESA